MNYTSVKTHITHMVREVTGQQDAPVHLHEPRFLGSESAYVQECIETGWVSSVGKFVDRFERELAEYTGAGYAVAVVNGTAALQIAMKVVGVEAEDEVLMPSLTFIATANAASYLHAVPHFVDVERETMGIDARLLADYLADIAHVKDGSCYNQQTGRRIKAVVPMHTLGHPVKIEALQEVCARYHLELVEDAAEALGSFYRGKHCGTFGKIAALSFNGNKIITTGGGGALITDDQRLAALAKHLTTTAKVAHAWEYEHDQIGYNFRMPNLNAALGCAQLEQLPAFLRFKRTLAHRYQQAAARLTGFQMFREPADSVSNYWLNMLLLDEEMAPHRDDILTGLHQNRVFARPMWKAMHRLAMYLANPRSTMTVTEDIERRAIHLPSSVQTLT